MGHRNNESKTLQVMIEIESGRFYFNLLFQTKKADDHLSIKSGLMRLPTFLEKYNNHSRDFLPSIVGTELTLNFPWKRLVEEADEQCQAFSQDNVGAGEIEEANEGSVRECCYEIVQRNHSSLG